MKKVSGVLGILKLVIKYGAYIAVAVRVVQFAFDEFSKVDAEKGETNGELSE